MGNNVDVELSRQAGRQAGRQACRYEAVERRERAQVKEREGRDMGFTVLDFAHTSLISISSFTLCSASLVWFVTFSFKTSVLCDMVSSI